MTATTALHAQTGLRYENADVLLFDPIFANRNTLRTSLEMLGFRRITSPVDHREIPELVRTRLFDLFVADVTQHTDDLCALVRALREGKACANPFAHVMLTAWKLDNELIRRALNCGADEFVTRPFSVSFLGARVKASTEQRASFVVTGDYVGPDRRRDQLRRNSAVPTFAAPNSMRAKCGERYDAQHASALLSEIDAAKERVGVDRIRRGSVQMPLVIRSLKEAFADMDALEPCLDSLMTLATDAMERAHHAGLAPVFAKAKALVREIAGAQDGVHVAAHIDEAARIATDLYLAANPGATLQTLEREIEELRAPLKRG
jgi:DNA-binding response OmpR family regulator